MSVSQEKVYIHCKLISENFATVSFCRLCQSQTFLRHKGPR